MPKHHPSKFSIVAIAMLVVMVFLGWLYFVNMGSQNESATSQTQSDVGASSDKLISSFDFAGLSPVVKGVITQANHSIVLTVPYGTDVSGLTPSIEVSQGASVSPASNIPENFQNTIIYTVTGADATHQDYTASVVIAPRPIQAILSFTVAGQVGDTVINQDNHTISLQVPYGTDVTHVAPTVELVSGASMSPTSDIAQNFTSPVTYTVTTSDDISQQYVVTVTVNPPSQ